jgi:S1-C subfamily serine protease
MKYDPARNAGGNTAGGGVVYTEKRLPKRSVEGKDKLDLAMPMNFVTTNGIIGGDSGSPVVNRNEEIVGLVFDGNIESFVGDFLYGIAANLTLAVHTAAMTEALSKLYGAQRLVDELLDK